MAIIEKSNMGMHAYVKLFGAPKGLPSLYSILNGSRETEGLFFLEKGLGTDIELRRTLIEKQGEFTDAEVFNYGHLDDKTFQVHLDLKGKYDSYIVSAIGTSPEQCKDIVGTVFSLFEDPLEVELQSAAREKMESDYHKSLNFFYGFLPYFQRYTKIKNRMKSAVKVEDQELVEDPLVSKVSMLLGQNGVKFDPTVQGVRRTNRVMGYIDGRIVELSMVYTSGHKVVPAPAGFVISDIQNGDSGSEEKLYVGNCFDKSSIFVGSSSNPGRRLAEEFGGPVYADMPGLIPAVAHHTYFIDPGIETRILPKFGTSFGIQKNKHQDLVRLANIVQSTFR